MRVGVSGMGSAGKRHYKNATELGYDVLRYDTAVDIGNRETLIEWADAIIIATPSDRHHLDLADCVAAGKHVLVEKPIGVVGTAASVEKSLAMAKDKGLVVAVGFNLRFHPRIEEIPEAKHDLKPYFGSFVCCQRPERTVYDRPNGLVNDWLCHELDLAQHLMGPLRLVDHHADQFSSDLLLTNWQTGARAFVHSDMRARGYVRRTLLMDDECTIDINLEAEPVTDDDYRAELAAFISKIGGDETPSLATGHDGLSVLRICEQVASCALSA